MKKALILTAVAEAGTGAALLIVPSLVGRLLFGEALAGVAIPVARVTGIALIAFRGRLLAGPAASRHVNLQRGYHAVSRLRRNRGRFDRHTPVASGRPARDPDGPIDSVINKKQHSGLDRGRLVLRVGSHRARDSPILDLPR